MRNTDSYTERPPVVRMAGWLGRLLRDLIGALILMALIGACGTTRAHMGIHHDVAYNWGGATYLDVRDYPPPHHKHYKSKKYKKGKHRKPPKHKKGKPARHNRHGHDSDWGHKRGHR